MIGGPIWACLWIMGPGVFSEDPSAKGSEQKTRHAVKAGLAFLEREIAAWNGERECISCHNAVPTLWALAEGVRRRFPVKQALLNDWLKKSNGINRPIPAESLAFFSLAMSGGKDGKNTGFTERLMGMQRADGSWKAGGQPVLAKRRPPRSQVEATLWAMLALTNDGSAKGASQLEQAQTHLAQVTLASTEALVLGLILAQHRGEGDRIKALTEKLWAAQNPDGGWGWRQGETSDAIATGQALFALTHTGAASEKGLTEGRTYLHTAQHENGSWTASTPVRGWNEEWTEKSVYWSTTWAVLGLMATQPDPAQNP